MVNLAALFIQRFSGYLITNVSGVSTGDVLIVSIWLHQINNLSKIFDIFCVGDGLSIRQFCG